LWLRSAAWASSGRLQRKMLIPEHIGTYIAYNPETGELRCIAAHHKSRIGTVVGLANQKGYATIGFEGRRFFVHRVAWFLMTGEQPPAVIDHRDLDGRNNRWDNLRAATISQNTANQRPRGRFMKGVTLHRTGRYQAQVKRAGRNHYLGCFDTEIEAHEAYVVAAKRLHGEFARAS